MTAIQATVRAGYQHKLSTLGAPPSRTRSGNGSGSGNIMMCHQNGEMKLFEEIGANLDCVSYLLQPLQCGTDTLGG